MQLDHQSSTWSGSDVLPPQDVANLRNMDSVTGYEQTPTSSGPALFWRSRQTTAGIQLDFSSGRFPPYSAVSKHIKGSVAW